MIKRLFISLKIFGLQSIIIKILLKIIGSAHKILEKLNHNIKYRDKFDKIYRTDTSGELLIKDTNLSESESKSGAQLYWATPEPLDRYLIGSLDIAFTDYTFIDFGSGKGRVLLVASQFPFQKIIGVEFVPELHEIAEKNIHIYKSNQQKCNNISSVCMDAVEFCIPETPIVLHFYHPFKSESKILSKVLNNIKKSLVEKPRPVWIIYIHHVDLGVIDTFAQFPFLQKKEEIKFIDSFWNTTIYTKGVE